MDILEKNLQKFDKSPGASKKVWNLFLRDLKSSNDALGSVETIFKFDVRKHAFLCDFCRGAKFSPNFRLTAQKALRILWGRYFPQIGVTSVNHTCQRLRENHHKCIYLRIGDALARTFTQYLVQLRSLKWHRSCKNHTQDAKLKDLRQIPTDT